MAWICIQQAAKAAAFFGVFINQITDLPRLPIRLLPISAAHRGPSSPLLAGWGKHRRRCRRFTRPGPLTSSHGAPSTLYYRTCTWPLKTPTAHQPVKA